jgi:hypothetical protein
MSCITASVRIVTKSLKVGPLLIFSISLFFMRNIVVQRQENFQMLKRRCSVCLFLSPWSDLHLVHDDEYDGEVEDLQRRVGQLEGAQVVVQTAQLILPTASAQLSSFSQRKIQGPIPPRLSPLIYEF